MNVNNVAHEISYAIKAGGIRTYVGPPESISEPCAVVVLPETITYSGTYSRGEDSMSWPILVLISRADDRTLMQRTGKYTDGSGANSIKALIESFAYTACDSVFVRQCQLDTVTWNGIDYQGALFTLDIVGTGS